MKKILLVLEDYNELLFVETLLKKVGFDSMGLQAESKIADALISFNPQMLITEGRGRKINGFQIAQKIKKSKGFPKHLVIVGGHEKFSAEELAKSDIAGTLIRPVHPVELSESIGHHLGIDPEILKDKFQKLGLFQDKKGQDKFRIVSGRGNGPKQMVTLKESPLTDDDRALRGRKAIEDLPDPKANGLNRKLVQQQVKDFRSREDDPEIRDIDEERFAFARQLFKRSN